MGALALLVAAAASAGCVQTSYEALVRDAPTATRGPSRVEVWQVRPEAPLREIGIVASQGRALPADLEWALRERAAAAGGEAVVDVRLDERADTAAPAYFRWLAGWLLPVRRMRGTVVVFTPPPPVSDAPGSPDRGGEP